jgi:hypothetical protein
MPASLSAQEPQIGIATHDNADAAFAVVKDRRAAQRKLARETGVTIQEYDYDGRSVSSLMDVPPELRDITILDEQQLSDSVISSIYKYYGFTGTETLKFLEKSSAMGNVKYVFQEYINNIETPVVNPQIDRMAVV